MTKAVCSSIGESCKCSQASDQRTRHAHETSVSTPATLTESLHESDNISTEMCFVSVRVDAYFTPLWELVEPSAQQRVTEHHRDSDISSEFSQGCAKLDPGIRTSHHLPANGQPSFTAMLRAHCMARLETREQTISDTHTVTSSAQTSIHSHHMADVLSLPIRSTQRRPSLLPQKMIRSQPALPISHTPHNTSSSVRPPPE